MTTLQLISIGEMARLQGVTRQTLIYYDDIDLFKPVKVDEKGFRFYSKEQIPYLSKICFLKSMGVKLQSIAKHLEAPSPTKEIALMQEQQKLLVAQINRLNRLRDCLNQRIDVYEEAIDGEKMGIIGAPFIQGIAARQAIYAEYILTGQSKEKECLGIRTSDDIAKRNTLATGNIGAIIKFASIKEENWLKDARHCIFLSHWEESTEGIVSIPSGAYACMYKYGAASDTANLEHLVSWLKLNGYELCGDVIDVCLLDGTFSTYKRGVDFGVLQAPIKRKQVGKK
ncbi:MAG: MerR family transcriptional regulator [Acidaminococcaceae bacterium]